MKKILTCAFLAAALITVPAVSMAQDDNDAPAGFGLMQYERYEVPAGPVTIYGQTLDPYLDYYEKPGEAGYEFIQKYNGYRWDDLKYKLPEIFPDAKVKKLSAAELCDMIVPLDKEYISKLEEKYYPLAGAIEPHFPELTEDIEFLDELDQRLRSKDDKALAELLAMMPEGWEGRLMVTKDFLLKSWAVSILHDAAINNCSSHAELQGYTTHTWTGAGADPARDPE